MNKKKAAGCGSSGSSSGSTNESSSPASLDGTYLGEADVTEKMSESAGMDIQTKLVMHVILTISNEKDYKIELDVDQFVADTKTYAVRATPYPHN